MAFHTIKGFLSSAVPTGLTFQSSYPSGTTQDSYVGQAAAELVMNQAEMSLQDGGFSVSLGALSITLTNLTGRTWPIGSEFYLQLDEPVTEFGLLEDELASGKQSIKLPEGRFGISGFNQFVQIEGAGQGSTIIEVSGTGAISLASRGAGLSNLTLRRASGGSANAILTSPVAGLTSWIDGVELFRTRVSNTNGTAIGQFSGVSHMLLIDDSTTGIEMNYRGIHHNAVIKAVKWPVKYSQSIAVQQSDSPASGVYARFQSSILQYTNATEGWGIYGLLENANGDHTSAEIIGNGPSYATWWATEIGGIVIRGACVPVGFPAATTPAIKGFLQGIGGIEIYADRITDFRGLLTSFVTFLSARILTRITS